MPSRSRKLTGHARSMRRDPTFPEAILWNALRRRALGVRFRRQEPIGPFIVDFACRSRRLIVEVDGAAHEDLERDLRRDDWLIRRGWFVLHLDNAEIVNDLESALDLIQRALVDTNSIPDPQNLEG